MKKEKNKNGRFVRCVIALTGMAVLTSICFSIFSGTFVFCYGLAVDGTDLGYTPSVDAYRHTLEEVNTKIIADFGAEAAIDPQPDITVCILPRENMPSERELYNHIASLSDHLSPCQALLIDEKEFMHFRSEEDAQAAITAYTDMFAPDGAQTHLEQTIRTEASYAAPSEIMDSERGLSYLIQTHPLTVTATAYEKTEQSIPFSETVTEDEAMYEGETATDQAGTNGKKTIVTLVHYKDGEELFRELISETIDAEPIEQKTRIGTKPVPKGIGSGSFLFPTSGTISSLMGERWNRQHKGIDIANSIGTDIHAADEGVVSFAGPRSSFGNLIILDHGNGYQTYYAHCDSLLKQTGEIVEKGETIAKMGSTGNSTGPHLHFEIRKNGEICNPLDYVSQPS